MTSSLSSDLALAIQSQASQCVKCGLCLPYCPTYSLSQNENESPRGRIALMHHLATESLSFSLKAHAHIDNCLSCKECERVCPAQVSYESLLLDYRAWEKPKLTAIRAKTTLSAYLFERIAPYPKLILALGQVLWLTQKLGLRTLAKKIGLIQVLGLTRLNALLPAHLSYPKSLMPYYAAIGKAQGTVALFTGCLSTLFDAQTNQDAITVLQHLGYNVYVPKNQTCCGAISSHAGYRDQGKRLSEQNIAAFANLPLSKTIPILTTASGCASMLLTQKSEQSIMDISDFIYHTPWPAAILSKITQNQDRFQHEKLAIHTPCTLRNSLKKPQVTQNLLEKLGFHCKKLQVFEQCCGSAGTYLLSHPSSAEALLDSALINLDQIIATRLITSNIGCALHFQKRFTEQKKTIRVSHPISLFAEILANS